ncbi:DNA topoisomerase 2-alpha-like isoform X1 [Lytechinus variegatus]|uniref:DNA topoisomerase 2-alpha-like isoform X1 n=1 Tax=Lytechinus variegatus TaxID=7654 RepID=UPI001BB1CA04|nr:DNA topoisomerase 2-alpha-like isoform X1 [Lytechinus variegatus]
MASDGPLKTLFDNAQKNEIADLPSPGQPGKGAKNKKRLSVERIYQKKTQLEHILLRPDTYIGSTEPVTQAMWVVDGETLVNREITFVPGLYKIFDEILVNAADNKQRDPKMDCIKITIDAENNTIVVWNNGKGIPVVEHKGEKMYIPEMIFGHLLTSSNYDDTQKKVTGGRNGYGAKLCNIFSKKFTVSTASKEDGKKFKQSWSDNMNKKGTNKLSSFDGSDYTEISFSPDLEKFKMSCLDRDTIALLTRRAYDIAGCLKGVKVFLNGKKLPVNGFKSYVDRFLKSFQKEDSEPLKVIHEEVNSRWEVCLCMSEKGFQQVSFVNSIATTKGGRHVDYVADQVITKLIETVKRKNKGGVNIKPFQIKNHLWVFVNCLIENPTFDSQTKENMTLQAKKFGSECKLSEKFIKGALTCGVVESIMSWMKFKAQSQLDKKCHSSKHSKLKGIPKLDDANDAGGKNSSKCTLILTEGDSAKTLAVSGLGVVGRDHYGVFPLRGKLLNVREASHKQIMENAEINNIIKILGLQYKNKYETPESLKTLRYGKLMIMTDQDQDGSHIKGLLINFIQHNWPKLLHHNFLEEFITPIVKVSKGKETHPFYSLPEFEEWKEETQGSKSWKVKYYKGLGTSTMKEAKEYFSDMVRHRIPFKYKGPEDDEAIVLAFSKKRCEDRKTWLTEFLKERKERKEAGLGEMYLYNKDTRRITYEDFINKELVLFSNMDNERSIPSMLDGLKPGQRKVVFTCFKKYEKKEIKVAQMAGAVAELSAYHHGETSLMSTIINLAQNFVGSNNVNLLQPIGQFGTRLHGGKDAASPRYIFTQLSPLTRLLFPAHDDNLLTYEYDDNQRIEPETYVPIIPMVLVNGSEGIGTGWSTKISNYDVREVTANVRRLVAGEEPVPMIPSYKGFKGTIEELEANRFVVSGEVSVIDNNTIEITELPVRTWTQVYKEQVLEPMLHGSEKVQPMITDYKEYHTDTTVKFVIKMSEDKLLKAEEQGLHKTFKLQSTISQANVMVLFDSHGCIRRYDNVVEILREFFAVRMELYHRRKAYLQGILEAESARLNNQARFILEKIEGKIKIENMPKKDMIQVLIQRGYDSDPVKAWKESQAKLQGGEDTEDEGAEEATPASGPDYNYLLGMALWSLTKEKKDELLKNRDDKARELEILKGKTASMLWTEDLDLFSAELDRVEAQEKEDESTAVISAGAKGAKGKAKPRKQKLLAKEETKPSPMGRRVVPRIDPALRKAVEGEKKRAKKVKAEPGEGKIKKEIKKEIKTEPEIPEEDREPLSLAERLAKAKSGGDGATKSKKQSTLSLKPIKKITKKLDSESDDDDYFGSTLVKKEKAPKRLASAKIEFTFSDEEEDDIEMSMPREMSDDSIKLEDLADEDDGDADGSFIAPPAKKKSKKAIIASDDEDDDAMDTQSTASSKKDEDLSPKPAAKPAKKPRAKATKSKESKKEKDEKQPSITDMFGKKAAPKRKMESSEDELVPVKKPAASKSAKKTVQSSTTSDSDDAFKKPATKKAAAKKPAKPKAKKAKKKAFDWSDDEDDDEDETSFAMDENITVPAREKTGRARATVKYNFSDDEDDDDY